MEYTNRQVRQLLRKVRTMLENGKIGPSQFDMSDVLYENKCGTVGCIGGWCLALSQNRDGHLGQLYCRTDTVDQEVHYDEPLHELFYSWGSRKQTPARAVKAITNYLDGKPDPWHGLR
jgi:hypothetical protein